MKKLIQLCVGYTILHIGLSHAQTLVNGANQTGIISTNNISDSYTFMANVGDTINLRLGTTNFPANLELYGPDGAPVDSASGGYDVHFEDTAIAAGTYTALVSSAITNQIGDYVLRLAQLPEAFVVPKGDEGGALTNGVNATGTITLGDMDMWTFTASRGDTINLRLGTTNFSANLELYGPDGSRVDIATGGNDVHIEDTAIDSGTFTALVSSAITNQIGDYVLRLAELPEAFVVLEGDDGGALTNGANATGTITLGDMDMWTFTANKGDTIELRLGTTNFAANLELFGPGGMPVDNAAGGYDVHFEDTATAAGTFTVLVSSASAGQTGDYVLRLAQLPEAFVVPDGDEGGALANGANATGTITLGDMDMWTFAVNKGDTINLRLGTTNFSANLELYGPDGSRVDIATGGNDVHLEDTATAEGTFTALVSSAITNQIGDYVLRLAQLPEVFVVPKGDEGGVLTNGANATGTITLGDMDMWTFAANKGDTLNLRLGTTNFSASLELYGPDGSRVDIATGENDVHIEDTATAAGTFTALVSSAGADQIGDYVLRLAELPEAFVVPAGDEGGVLTNGANATGTITLGDMDMWTFAANKGDTINLRLGTTNFSASLELYGPDGARVDSAEGGNDVHFEDTTIAGGTFTALVSSANSNQIGDYVLRLAELPEAFMVPVGDEGGPMTGATQYFGMITLADMDMWSFTAVQGDLINLQLNTTGFLANLELYGPDGSQVDSAAGEDDAHIQDIAKGNGTYTALVSSFSAGQTGNYILYANGLSVGGKVSSPQVSGATIDLTMAGGKANGFFILYSAADIATPFDHWQPVMTNRFDQFGIFNYTGAFDPVSPKQQYFRFVQPQ